MIDLLLNRGFSILLGFLAGYLIVFYLKPREHFHGPNSNHVRKEIFTDQEQCYQLIPAVTFCPVA